MHQRLAAKTLLYLCIVMEESIYPFALFALCEMKGREGADPTSISTVTFINHQNDHGGMVLLGTNRIHICR